MVYKADLTTENGTIKETVVKKVLLTFFDRQHPPITDSPFI